MEKPVFFDSITIPVDKEQIYRRLGYQKDTTHLSAAQEKDTDAHIAAAAVLIQLKGAAIILDIERCDHGKIILENNIVFESANLAAMLKDSVQVLLMAATAGRDIMLYIRGDNSKENLSRAVAYDAAASELVDGALDWMVSYFNRKLLRENKRVTPNRFSCGYGDFFLVNQKAIYDALNMERIGVKITDSFILDPEKSVTAVAGILSAAT